MHRRSTADLLRHLRSLPDPARAASAVDASVVNFEHHFSPVPTADTATTALTKRLVDGIKKILEEEEASKRTSKAESSKEESSSKKRKKKGPPKEVWITAQKSEHKRRKR